MAIVKTVNWEGGSNARYDLSQMTPEERAMFDSEGRPLFSGAPGDGPDQWTPGLPGARGGSGPGDMGGGGFSGGGDGGALLSNPYFQQAKSGYQAESTADRAGVIADARRLLAQFGLIPQGFNDQLGILDDTTRGLIEANTKSGISQYARLLEGKDDVRNATVRDLAARGLGRSGARGYKLRRGALDFDRNLSDAITAVLGNVEQGQSGFAQREIQRKNALAQFLAQLASQWAGGGRGGGYSPPAIPSAPAAPQTPSWLDLQPGARGTPTIGGGYVGDGSPEFRLGGGSGTSSKKPLLF